MFKNYSATRKLHAPRPLLSAGKLFKGFLSFIVVVPASRFLNYTAASSIVNTVMGPRFEKTDLKFFEITFELI